MGKLSGLSSLCGKRLRIGAINRRERTQQLSKVLLLFGLASLGSARSMATLAQDLTHLSIEDLMRVKVVSVAKIEQSLQDTAAAVFVITAEDIHQSGATSVPEAL